MKKLITLISGKNKSAKQLKEEVKKQLQAKGILPKTKSRNRDWFIEALKQGISESEQKPNDLFEELSNMKDGDGVQTMGFPKKA